MSNSIFWKNAGIMVFAELFLKLKALIMMPFITKYLGAVNYGIWSQVMVIVSLLSPLVFFGMDNSLARFLPGKSLAQQRQDFTGWLLFGLVSSIVICCLLGVLSHKFAEWFFGSNAEIYSAFIVLSGLNIVMTSLLTGIRNWFRIQNNAWALVFITIAQNLLQMMVLILVLITKQGIYELVLWSLIIDSSMILLYVIYMFTKQIFARPSWDWLKPYFRFGIVLLPSGYAVWVLNSLDRIFLAQYHSLADIGVYSICFTIGYTLVQMIVNPIWSLFPTKAAELYNVKNFIEVNRLFNQSIKLICWLIFPSILGLIIVGQQLLQILSTNEFADGYLTVPIILSGYLFSMLSSYFETVLVLKDKPYLSTIFTVLACLVNIVLNFLLIPKFSYMGAAIATMLSFGVQLCMSYAYAAQEDLIALDRKSIIKISVASMVMYIMTYLAKISLFSFESLPSLVSLIALGIVIYLSLTHVFKIYSIKQIVGFFKKDQIYV